MDHERLFDTVSPMVRQGGGIAVISNGTPLWLQDSLPSHALRRFLEHWLNMPVGENMCGTDAEARQRYAGALERAGFEVSEVVAEFRETLDLEQIVGGMYSAMSPRQLPAPERRDLFATQLAVALPADEPFVEVVRVVALIARK